MRKRKMVRTNDCIDKYKTAKIKGNVFCIDLSVSRCYIIRLRVGTTRFFTWI